MLSNKGPYGMSTLSSPLELQQAGKEIAVDSTSPDMVAALSEMGFINRLYDPLANQHATEQLGSLRSAWRKSGNTVVFTQGVFDMFHLNHSALLLYSKMSAVPYHYDAHESGSWQALSAEEQFGYTVHALSSGAIRQVVSIDGNAHVSARKNNDPEKPSSRPILHWETRARDVMLASAAVDGITARFLVDAVTMHDKIRPELADTPHASITDIASFVDPDIWAIHSDSPQIIAALENDIDGRFSRIQPVILPNRGPYEDGLAGEISTSSIIARTMGGIMLDKA